MLARLNPEVRTWRKAVIDAAFDAGQLEAFHWLRTQLPVKPWTFPDQKWVSNVPSKGTGLHKHWRRGYFSSTKSSNLLNKRLRLVEIALQHAASASSQMIQSAEQFYDELAVQMLGALSKLIVLDNAQLKAGVAGSGRTAAMRWLLANLKAGSWDAGVCAAAAEAGHVAMVELLRSQNPPCPWDERSGMKACCSGHQPVLECLQALGYPWTEQWPKIAASRGHCKLLEWMRSQDGDWLWDSSVCTAAQQHTEALRWLLAQTPPCPWTAADAAACPDAMARLGDTSLIQRLQLPVQDMPQLCVSAARLGQLDLLKWLLGRQPPCPLTAEAFNLALRLDDPEMVRFLIAWDAGFVCHHPDFESISKASPAGFLELARNGCCMRQRHAARVLRLVEAWYVFVGLQHWAANQATALAELSDSTANTCQLVTLVISLEAAARGTRAGAGQKVTCHLELRPSEAFPGGPKGLLAQLTRLPSDLVDRIASDAFLSPEQASGISITPYGWMPSRVSIWDKASDWEDHPGEMSFECFHRDGD